MNITHHGLVSIEDCVKHAGYPDPQFAPTRKVKVEISFDVMEDVDYQDRLDVIAAVVQSKVTEMLGAKPAAVRGATAAEAAAPKKPTAAEKKAAAVATGKSDKEKLADAAGVGSEAIEGLETSKSEPVVDEDDGLGDLLGTAAPAPITDAELGKAAQKKNVLMKQKDPAWEAVKIRKLVEDYAGATPKKITDIPAAKRGEFLVKLEALA